MDGGKIARLRQYTLPGALLHVCKTYRNTACGGSATALGRHRGSGLGGSFGVPQVIVADGLEVGV